MKELSTFSSELIEAQPLLHSYVVSCLPGYPESVRDVVQRVNEALVRREDAFDPARPFVPWAIGFARQQVRAFLNEQKRERVLYDSEYIDAITDSYAAPEPERSRYRPDDIERLEICKSRLREQQRKLLDLRYGQELPIEEIARLTANKTENVKSNLSYIRSRLADCIRKLCDLSRDKPTSAPPMNRLKSLTSDLLDGGSLAESEERALRGILAEPSDREEYLDELEVHALLGWSSRVPHVAARPRVWPRRLAAAAALAVLLAGIAYAVIAVRGKTAVSAVLPVAAVPEPEAEAPAALAAPAPAAPAAAIPAAHSISRTASVPGALAQQKEETNTMKMTNQVKAAVAAAVVSAASAVLPAAASATSDAVSGGFDLDTRAAGAASMDSLNLEARDFSTAFDWNLNLLTTTPRGGAVILR